METNTQQHEALKGKADKYRMKLEDQITEMKRTIEDLKQKVIEQKEQLWKESQENESMIKEQEMFRKQLNTFHLPHCPVLNSPPCPVHSRMIHQQSSLVKETDLFQEDKDLRHDAHVYRPIARTMRLEAEGSCEDLFAVRHSPTPSAHDVTNFTLSLTDSCQNRLREALHQRDAMSRDTSLTTPDCSHPKTSYNLS